MLAAIPRPASAQLASGGGATASVPADLPPDKVEGYVAPLTDAQARGLLIEVLKKDADPAAATEETEIGPTPARVLEGLREAMFRMGAGVARLWEALGLLPRSAAIAFRNLTDQRGWVAVGEALLVLAAMSAVGTACGGVLVLGIRRLRPQRHDHALHPDVPTPAAMVVALASDATVAAAFFFTAYATSFAFFARYDPLREFVTSLLIVASVGGFAWRVVRPFLRRGWRPAWVDDITARALHRRFALTAGLLAALFVLPDLLVILGLERDLVRVVVLLLGAALAVVLVGLCLVVHHASAAPGSPRAVRTATSFGIPALLAVLLVWGIDVVLDRRAEAMAAGSAVLIGLGAILIDAFLHGVGIAGGDAPAGPAGVNGAAQRPLRWRFVMTLRYTVRVLALLVAIALVAEALGFGVRAALATPGGREVLRDVVNVGITLVLAYAGWHAVRHLLDRHIGRIAAPGEAATPGSRAQTLLPLFRNFLFAVLLVLVTLIVLSSIGLDIGPLLAGAGVVGLAIGFGAQTLVKDIVSGIFFLIDDAFRIGEYVEIGALRGTVEGMSLRSLKLRHHRGHLHTIPFGELNAITNYSRDWVIVKLDLNLTYDTDVDLVKRLLKQIGREMMTDPELGPHILEPLKSQGISQLGDFSIVVRAKFMAKPGEQFVVRREAFRRIKQAFAEHGITFAYPTVTINQAAGGGPISPSAAAEIAAAAGVDLGKPPPEPA